MALAWAVEPSALSVPLEHVGAAPAAAAVEDPAVVLEPPALLVVLLDDPLLLLLQAASAVTATSTPATAPARLSFTIGSPSSIDLSIATLGARNGASGEPW
jgi:hypothetical protein